MADHIRGLLPTLMEWRKWSRPTKLGIVIGVSAIALTVVFGVPQFFQSDTLSVEATTLIAPRGDHNQSFGNVHGDVTLHQGDVIHNAARPAAPTGPDAPNSMGEPPEPFMTRTFDLLREDGSAFTVDVQGRPDCIRIELGELKRKGDYFVQQLLLSGDAFFYQFPDGVTVANVSRGSGPPEWDDTKVEGKNVVNLRLREGEYYEVLSWVGTVRITVADIRVDSLKLKVEVTRHE